MRSLLFASFYTHHVTWSATPLVSRTQTWPNIHFIFQALGTLKLLILLMSRVVVGLSLTKFFEGLMTLGPEIFSGVKGLSTHLTVHTYDIHLTVHTYDIYM